MFRALLLTVDYTATLDVAISAPLCPEAKLFFFFFPSQENSLCIFIIPDSVKMPVLLSQKNPKAFKFNHIHQ